MVQGTGSHVGKSLIVAGLARAFTRRGLAVRPFKPQNMSNNAAVTADGGEIGRAQALQARACGVAPTVHMNPVLLKPQADATAQLVVQGRVLGAISARDYRAAAPALMPRVIESFDLVSAGADLVLAEGAGSPAETNLRDGDIANMGFAEAADLPVVLVGDIDRGGVIASLVGTAELLDGADRARLCGYIINKFRGDPELFRPALAEIAARTGLSCFGIVPFLPAAARLPAEDSVALDDGPRNGPGPLARAGEAIRIAVPRLPRMANFDDLDPLAQEPGVIVDVVQPGRPIPLEADVVLLPGSKAVLADLDAVRAEGWDIDILAFARRGGRIIGLCGGYQMLGRHIADPGGIEGAAREVKGLGLLDVATVLGPVKTLGERTGADVATGEPVAGYEMHMGATEGPDRARPVLLLDDGDGARRPEGARTADGRVTGSYLHGLFGSDSYRRAWLAHISGATRPAAPDSYDRRVEAALDELAAHLEAHVDLDGLIAIARGEWGMQGAPLSAAGRSSR
ncbi:MAG: cobyric acid synthase [Alphaproteobacteria bacterium]